MVFYLLPCTVHISFHIFFSSTHSLLPSLFIFSFSSLIHSFQSNTEHVSFHTKRAFWWSAISKGAILETLPNPQNWKKKKCALGFQNGTLRFGNLTCILKSQSASFPFWHWRRTPTTGYLFYLGSRLVDPDFLFLNVSVNVILFYSTRLIFNFTLPKI